MSTIPTFVFPLLCTVVAGQTPVEKPSDAIRLNVNLVVINVTVRSGNGGAVSGLNQEAFRLYVDDVQRPIDLFRAEDAPVTVGLVVDNSVSMAPKRSEVIAAASAFARSSNPQDQMFVVHFNDRAWFGLPPERPFTASIPELEAALAHFTPAGTTALYDAIGLALSHLGRAAVDRKVLVMITDGGDNSSRTPLPAILQWAQESGVVFFCIGLFEDSNDYHNPEVLTQFAELTGGRAFFPSDVKDTTKVCVDIAREIRSQYTLGFAGAEDGEYHRIRVTVQETVPGKLSVLTRPGYFAAKP